MANLRLLLKIAGSEEESTGTITETHFVDASVLNSGYSLSELYIGKEWENNTAYICTSISVNDDIQNLYLNGNTYQVVTLQATYTIDYDRYSDLETAHWKMQFSSGGYQTFQINTGATWEDSELPVIGETNFELKVPITNLQMQTKIFGSFDDELYSQYTNKINQYTFKGRSPGTVLFDNFSTVLHHNNDGTENWYELTLNFKILPQDWNLQWVNRVQATNPIDKSPLIWQNIYPDSDDYTTDTSKLGLPIWCGEISGTQAYSEGWDKIIYYDSLGEAVYLYQYDDLGVLIGDPHVPEPDEGDE